jgi:hypothetical protein
VVDEPAAPAAASGKGEKASVVPMPEKKKA